MFECCCDYDNDPAEIFDERMIKGRKDHVCCECRDTIKKGEQHRITEMLFEGNWSRDRTCLTCVAIRKDHGDCMPVGYLKENLLGCGWKPDDLGF